MAWLPIVHGLVFALYKNATVDTQGDEKSKILRQVDCQLTWVFFLNYLYVTEIKYIAKTLTNLPAGTGLSWLLDILDSFDNVKSSTCSARRHPEKRGI